MKQMQWLISFAEYMIFVVSACKTIIGKGKETVGHQKA